MKRLFTLILISLFALGCQTLDKDKLVELQDFTLTAHEDWEVIFYGSKEVRLKVPGDTYHFDYLTLTFKPDTVTDLTDMTIAGTMDDITVYDQDCGGAYDCFYFQIGEDKYSAIFNTSSQETPPENLDGIWIPNVDVDTQDMIDFLLTAER